MTGGVVEPVMVVRSGDGGNTRQNGMFSVEVERFEVLPTSQPQTFSVTNVSPSQAVLNEKTFFALFGTGFLADMAYTIQDCDNQETMLLTSNQLIFS